MKKLFLAFTLALSVLTLSAVASDVHVSGKVLASFKKNFNKVSNLQWAEVKGLYQAQFTMDEQQYSAYFNPDGSMVVVARFLTITQLPHGLQQSLKSEAGDHTIAYLFELSDEEGVHYYAAIQKEGKKEMLQSVGTKKWAPYKKIKI